MSDATEQNADALRAAVVRILSRENHVGEWPADEAAAYRNNGRFESGHAALFALRADKIIALVRGAVQGETTTTRCPSCKSDDKRYRYGLPCSNEWHGEYLTVSEATTDETTRVLLTEPHDGHPANERCPGCPHIAEQGITRTWTERNGEEGENQ